MPVRSWPGFVEAPTTSLTRVTRSLARRMASWVPTTHTRRPGLVHRLSVTADVRVHLQWVNRLPVVHGHTPFFLQAGPQLDGRTQGVGRVQGDAGDGDELRVSEPSALIALTSPRTPCLHEGDANAGGERARQHCLKVGDHHESKVRSPRHASDPF